MQNLEFYPTNSNVLRQIKFEFKHRNRLDTDVFIDTDLWKIYVKNYAGQLVRMILLISNLVFRCNWKHNKRYSWWEKNIFLYNRLERYWKYSYFTNRRICYNMLWGSCYKQIFNLNKKQKWKRIRFAKVFNNTTNSCYWFFPCIVTFSL